MQRKHIYSSIFIHGSEKAVVLECHRAAEVVEVVRHDLAGEVGGQADVTVSRVGVGVVELDEVALE